jgi:hypothetical protein
MDPPSPSPACRSPFPLPDAAPLPPSPGHRTSNVLPPIGRAMSDPSPSPARPPIPHTEFGIRKLEMLMPWHRMMERDRAGQLDGGMERLDGAVFDLPFPAPRTPPTVLPPFPPPPTRWRPLPARLRGIHISPPNPPLPPIHRRVLKNRRRARGVLKRPRSVSALRFLTP